jgi:hypothetical protein
MTSLEELELRSGSDGTGSTLNDGDARYFFQNTYTVKELGRMESLQ